MPPTLESPAPSLPPATGRRRCTDVVAILNCTALEVAISGDRCALMLASPQGTTRVLLPTARFVEGARGPHDCNGHPFPSLAALRGRSSEAVLATDAAATVPKQQPRPVAVKLPRRAFGEAQKLYAEGWLRWSADPTQTLTVVADALGINSSKLSDFFCEHHAADYARLRTRRPRGIRSLAAVAAAGLPLLKPSASAL